MLVSVIPPNSNLTKWFYNLFNQIKAENAASSTNDAADNGLVSPVISSTIVTPIAAPSADNSTTHQPAAGISTLTAFYGTMLLEAELAVPGPPGPFAVSTDIPQGNHPQTSMAPSSQAMVAASQAAETYQASARTMSDTQTSAREESDSV